MTPTTCPGCGAPWEMPCSYCGARRSAVSLGELERIAGLLCVPGPSSLVPARAAYALMGARTLEARYATLPRKWTPVGDVVLMDDGCLEVTR